jgi:hypothetical protein
MNRSLARRIEDSKKIRCGFLEDGEFVTSPPMKVGDVITIKDPMNGIMQFMIVPKGDKRAKKNQPTEQGAQ